MQGRHGGQTAINALPGCDAVLFDVQPAAALFVPPSHPTRGGTTCCPCVARLSLVGYRQLSS